MVQSLVVYNLKNKVIAWYTNPKLKLFKLDGAMKLDINGQTILTLGNYANTTIDIAATLGCNWKLKQVSGTRYEIADDSESNLIKFGDFDEQEL